jgi:hypothetical protein
MGGGRKWNWFQKENTLSGPHFLRVVQGVQDLLVQLLEGIPHEHGT